MMTTSTRLLLIVSGIALLTTGGCISTAIVVSRVGVDSARKLAYPSKAQLIDGSIVTFPDGARVDSGRVVGEGWRYGTTLHDSVRVISISADSVATLVAFRTAYDPAKSVGMTFAGAVATLLAGMAALFALCWATECLR
jgi:hypothetical protein